MRITPARRAVALFVLTFVLALLGVAALLADAARPAERSPGCETQACSARVCTSSACRARVAAAELARRPHRPALASWYGPGLYGNPLACGGRLGVGTLGVAHKAIACGTRVRVCRRGCVTVRVIDRGPYVGAREFDLTAATAQAIGFGGVGVVRVRVGG